MNILFGNDIRTNDVYDIQGKWIFFTRWGFPRFLIPFNLGNPKGLLVKIVGEYLPIDILERNDFFVGKLTGVGKEYEVAFELIGKHFFVFNNPTREWLKCKR